MNRRTFASIAAGAALPARAAAPIRIAFLGAQHSHAAGKIRVVEESPAYELAGIWEPSEPVRRSLHNVKLLARDQILNDRSIRAVAVESDVPDHAEHARLALDAGKHLHLEKPPADSLAAFRELQALARRHEAIVQVGYMWRYNPAVKAALEAARSGWLGDVYLIRATMNTLIDATRRKEWARFPGGQMFEQGAHLCDMLVRLLGRPARVTPFLRKHGRYDDTLMDNTVAVLEWPGTLGVITASTLQPDSGPHRFLEIAGTAGTALVKPTEPPGLTIDLARDSGPYKAGLQQVPMPPYQRYVDDFKDLAECIREGRALSVTPEQDFEIQETLLRASAMM